jgi:hypothetical protein
MVVHHRHGILYLAYEKCSQIDSVLGLKRVNKPLWTLDLRTCRSLPTTGGHDQYEQPIWDGIQGVCPELVGADRSSSNGGWQGIGQKPIMTIRLIGTIEDECGEVLYRIRSLLQLGYCRERYCAT